MTIDTAVLADLQAGLIHIDRGSHQSYDDGHCSMGELAAAQRQVALDILDRMIDPSVVTA